MDRPCRAWRTLLGKPWLEAFIRRPEMLVFGLVLLLVNAPLAAGSGWHSLVFEPGAVGIGQWWRLLTHPFVHVTWYHLVLDGTAFFVLYHSLLEKSLCRRLGFIFAGGIGSLLATYFGADLSSGLCGLSGIAHGLMGVSALELILAKDSGSVERRIGMASLGIVVAKAGYEALTGHMFFSFLDFGLLGSPIAASHAGGIIGALLLMLVFRLSRWDVSRLPEPVEGEHRHVFEK